MYQKILIVLIVVNIPIFVKLFKTVFPTKIDFMESLRYSATNNIISMFRGEYMKDKLAESRLSLFLLISAGLIGLEFVMMILFIRIYATYN